MKGRPSYAKAMEDVQADGEGRKGRVWLADLSIGSIMWA